MANNIAKFKKYIDLLDEVYKVNAKTSILDGDNTLVRAGANADEIIIPKMTLDGLADYSRNSGYVNGDVTLTNETVKFNYDRGRAFTVDAMDNEETAGIAFGKLSSEFIRTKVVPEVDAFRLATYAGIEGISSATGTLADGNAALSAIVAAVSKMDDDEVAEEGRVLFITPTLYNLILNVDTSKSKEIMSRFSSVVTVPQSRFYTAIELADGTTGGETAGGFTKAADAKDINFMIVQRSAVLQYPKHVVNKVVSPEENQTSDGWKFFYRSYGLADVYENKVAGIYLHHKA
ncbi:MAG: hypothetical protein UHK60_10945 [Acutalibacteraceae bacterium]|nr:hypothetical protein [Acutalibacteraceae bacterium]